MSVNVCNNCGFKRGDEEQGLACARLFVDTGFTGLAEVDYNLLNTDNFPEEHDFSKADTVSAYVSPGASIYLEVDKTTDNLEFFHTQDTVRFFVEYRNHTYGKTLGLSVDLHLYKETVFSDGTIGLEYKK